MSARCPCTNPNPSNLVLAGVNSSRNRCQRVKPACHFKDSALLDSFLPSAVDRMWHAQHSQDQHLILAFRSNSLTRFDALPFCSFAVLNCCRHPILKLLLFCCITLQPRVIHKSMSLRYEPSSEPLHISAKLIGSRPENQSVRRGIAYGRP